jgi:hypothetical protein
LSICLYGVSSTVLVTAIAVFGTSRWRMELVALLAKSWVNTLGARSQTTLSVVLFLLVCPILTFIVANTDKLRSWDSVMAHLTESLKASLIGFAVPLCLVASVFGWNVCRTVYEGHQSLVKRNQELSGIGGGNPYTIPLNNQYAATINTLNAFKALAENGHRCILRISYPDKVASKMLLSCGA